MERGTFRASWFSRCAARRRRPGVPRRAAANAESDASAVARAGRRRQRRPPTRSAPCTGVDDDYAAVKRGIISSRARRLRRLHTGRHRRYERFFADFGPLHLGHREVRVRLAPQRSSARRRRQGAEACCACLDLCTTPHPLLAHPVRARYCTWPKSMLDGAGGGRTTAAHEHKRERGVLICSFWPLSWGGRRKRRYLTVEPPFIPFRDACFGICRELLRAGLCMDCTRCS